MTTGWGRVGADRWVVPAMDTVFSLVAPPLAGRAGADALVDALIADWRDLEARLSVFSPGSEVNRWREGRLADAGRSPVLVEAVAACERLEARTDGAFSAHYEGEFDPTGFVKGWALARSARTLERAGVGAYCLNGGGDVVLRGTRADGTPWRVGVAHPYRPGVLATVITVPDGERLAVATSGTSQRGAHIVHPGDGWRPRHSAVTVVGEDMALVDPLATAALALGRDGSAAPSALVTRLGCEAFGFGEDGRPWWTPGMPRCAALPGA